MSPLGKPNEARRLLRWELCRGAECTCTNAIVESADAIKKITELSH